MFIKYGNYFLLYLSITVGEKLFFVVLVNLAKYDKYFLLFMANTDYLTTPSFYS